jgi:hypothetical protein
MLQDVIRSKLSLAAAARLSAICKSNAGLASAAAVRPCGSTVRAIAIDP